MKKIITCFLLFCSFFLNYQVSAAKSFTLPPLPYAENALAPFISARTLFYHYRKHHQGYVDTLNKLMKEKGLTPSSLEQVIQMSSKNPELKTVFNNAAQDWNHTFYWSSMKPMGGGQPSGPILDLIIKTFGSYEAFKKQFIEAGAKLFGSGWVWLILDKDNALKIAPMKDADLPMIHGQKALLTCDVWEHAYYLDYQNRRKDYVEVFLDHLVNWDFANENLGK